MTWKKVWLVKKVRILMFLRFWYYITSMLELFFFVFTVKTTRWIQQENTKTLFTFASLKIHSLIAVVLIFPKLWPVFVLMDRGAVNSLRYSFFFVDILNHFIYISILWGRFNLVLIVSIWPAVFIVFLWINIFKWCLIFGGCTFEAETQNSCNWFCIPHFQGCLQFQ